MVVRSGRRRQHLMASTAIRWILQALYARLADTDGLRLLLLL